MWERYDASALTTCSSTAKRHLRHVLAKYEQHYNDHRPHHGRALRPPLYEPSEMIDITTRIRRRETVNGLINEYSRVA